LFSLEKDAQCSRQPQRLLVQDAGQVSVQAVPARP